MASTITYEKTFEGRRVGKVVLTITIGIAPLFLTICLGGWLVSTTMWWPYLAAFILGALSALMGSWATSQLKRRPKIDASSNLAIHLSNASDAIWGIQDNDFSLSWRADVRERIEEFFKCRSIESAQRAITSVARFVTAKPEIFRQQVWVSGLKKLATDAGFDTDGFPS